MLSVVDSAQQTSRGPTTRRERQRRSIVTKRVELPDQVAKATEEAIRKALADGVGVRKVAAMIGVEMGTGSADCAWIAS
jgi:flagellar biosynthesis/type III secretory pathway M-ring protein FliF/YscJ